MQILPLIFSANFTGYAAGQQGWQQILETQNLSFVAVFVVVVAIIVVVLAIIVVVVVIAAAPTAAVVLLLFLLLLLLLLFNNARSFIADEVRQTTTIKTETHSRHGGVGERG